MRGSVPSLTRSIDGAVAPTVALSLVALIALGGIAFDYARLATMDTELQSAADQAALAAASQLDREDGACERAVAAAQNLVTNQTRFGNFDATSGADVTIANPGVCNGDTTITFNANASIRFYTTKDKSTVATDDSNARFVEVTVDGRSANYALTPVVAAISSGSISATAYAGLGSAICKVPPLMICNPNPGTPFPPTPGLGIKVVAHQNGQSWSSGNFGFLNVGQANNGAPDLLAAMAYQDAALTCQDIDTGDVDTGATVPAIDAANTRFDIYNFGGGSGSTLGQCLNGACPAAQNVTKDLINTSNFTGNACRLDKNDASKGWFLITGANAFAPRPAQTGDTPMTQIDANATITAMGLPRDNCHYASFGSACTGDRIGDGKWGRGDYFNKYHSGRIPANAATMTRYETYRWEIENNYMPGANGTSVNGQWGVPKCSTGTLDPARDRRVVTVAIADNCAALSGSSVPVQIGSWIDMFFVEPGVNGRGNGSTNDELYFEVIREAQASGDGSNAQVIRRDVPYLIQ